MSESKQEKLARLVRVEGVPLASAARAVGLSRARARTILASSTPYGPPSTGQSPPNIPPPAYGADQPPVIPGPGEDFSFRAGYHDRTFRSFAAPIFFGDFHLQKARVAIDLHDQGLFIESSRLAIAMTRFAPVFAGLLIRCAPAISLPRYVLGGSKGLARVAREEVEAQIAPGQGLVLSPYFPAYLWCSIQLGLAQMGFAVLQHVFGPADDRGVRRVYTRIWPHWAVQYYRYRRTYVALTTEGPVDILNDGKFTIIGKSEEPHFQGAIRALVTPVLDGVQTQQARGQWIDRFADPKFIATAPEGTAVRSPEGQALASAIMTLFGPEGKAVLPFGAKFEAIGLDAKAATPFKDALDSDNAYISAILTGTDISPGTGGVYKSPMFWGILRATVGDDLQAIVRGVNAGHIAPYLAANYQAGIEQAKSRGIWADPVLTIPLPDPEADARIDSYAKRRKALTDQILADRAAGAVVSQESVDALAEKFEVETIELLPVDPTTGDLFQYHIESKIVAPDEVRARLGLDPLPNGEGSLEKLAEERAQGKDKTGTKPAEADLAAAKEPAEGDSAAPASYLTPAEDQGTLVNDETPAPPNEPKEDLNERQ